MPNTERSRRVLLKLSGEALADENQQGLSAERLSEIAKDVVTAVRAGIEVAIVVGGGNFIRGCKTTAKNLQRITADHMGMLATNINGLALRDAIEHEGGSACLFSALPVAGIADCYNARVAIAALSEKKVVIFTGGTGNPFVTTDSASSLRSVEIHADILLKATKVDGVYDADPLKYPQAKRYDFLTYTEALQKELAVMDLAAFCQCRDYNIPIRVFNLFKPGALHRALIDSNEGTLVATDKEQK